MDKKKAMKMLISEVPPTKQHSQTTLQGIPHVTIANHMLRDF